MAWANSVMFFVELQSHASGLALLRKGCGTALPLLLRLKPRSLSKIFRVSLAFAMGGRLSSSAIPSGVLALSRNRLSSRLERAVPSSKVWRGGQSGWSRRCWSNVNDVS